MKPDIEFLYSDIDDKIFGPRISPSTTHMQRMPRSHDLFSVEMNVMNCLIVKLANLE